MKEPLERDESSHMVVYACDGDYAPSSRERVIWGWKRDALPAMFMPQWAAGAWVRILDVRAERVQEITEDDALAEGIVPAINAKGIPIFTYGTRNLGGFRFARDAYAALWDIINAKRGCSWADNPWVFAYTFEQVEKPEEAK